MLAPCQVRARDGTGLIQASPFISNHKSMRPLLRAYCFGISGCNVSGRQAGGIPMSRASLHPAFDVVKLPPHFKACRSHCTSPAWPTIGIQKSISQVDNELTRTAPFSKQFKTREERCTSLPILPCLRVRKEHISHHFHHSWLTPILTTSAMPDASVPARACKQIQLPGSCERARHLSGFN